jgi:hypothetical protein
VLDVIDEDAPDAAHMLLYDGQLKGDVIDATLAAHATPAAVGGTR